MSILTRKPNRGNRGSLVYNSTPFTFYKGEICHLDKILGTPPPFGTCHPPPPPLAGEHPPPLWRNPGYATVHPTHYISTAKAPWL